MEVSLKDYGAYGLMMMASLCCCIVALHILREWHRVQCSTVAMAAPQLLTSGLARCEAAFHGYGTSRFVCITPQQQYFSYIMAVI